MGAEFWILIHSNITSRSSLYHIKLINTSVLGRKYDIVLCQRGLHKGKMAEELGIVEWHRAKPASLVLGSWFLVLGSWGQLRGPYSKDGRQCESGSWPISRVLSRTVIHLGCLSPDTSSNLPGSNMGHAKDPYSVLLQVGFTLPTLLPVLRCALTAPFHPYSVFIEITQDYS